SGSGLTVRRASTRRALSVAPLVVPRARAPTTEHPSPRGREHRLPAARVCEGSAMATAVEIANAYIALTVKAPGIKKAVDRELGAVSASGDTAGRSIGNRLTGALGKVA